MKVLVCGGRDYDDRQAVERRLAQRPFPSLVIHGGSGYVRQGKAYGADYLAAQVAYSFGIHVAEVRALWDAYGRQAGPLRNAAMLRLQPDLVLAFRGGRGTENCIAQAEAAGIRVERVEAA